MTPEIRLAAIILQGQKLLLLQHLKRGKRYWVLPGGRLQAGETLQSALRRELREELSVGARIGRLVIVCETLAPDRHVVNLIFESEIAEGRPQLDTKDPVLAGMDWFDPARLGAIDLRPPIAASIQETIASNFDGPARLLGDTWIPGIAVKR